MHAGPSNIGHTRRGKGVHVTYERDSLMIFDDRGTPTIEHPWPTLGVRYVGNGQPRGQRKQL